jgi:hypothetical protein
MRAETPVFMEKAEKLQEMAMPGQGPPAEDVGRVKGLAAYGVPDADIAASLGIGEAELVQRHGRVIAEARATAKAMAGKAMLERATKGAGRDADRAAEAFLRLNGAPGPGGVAPPAPGPAPAPATEAATEPALTCNFEEMAEKLGVSKPTLGQWIRRWEDFPVLSRGSNGVPWRFDPHAVVAFVAARRAEDEASNAARAELLGQIALPFEQPSGAADLAEMGQIYKLAKQADELGVTRGQYLRVADLRDPMWSLLTAWRQSALHLPRKWGARHNLPAPVVAAIRHDIEEWLTEIHAGAREILTAAAVPEIATDNEAAAAAA